LNICLVVAPFVNSKDAKTRISSFLKWMSGLANNINIVTGNFPYTIELEKGPLVKIFNVGYDFKKQNLIARAIRHVILQIKISLAISKVIKGSDVLVFWLCGTFILPMLVGKMLNRKIIFFVTGSWSECAKVDFQNSLFGVGTFVIYHFERQIERIIYILSDKLVLLSPNLKEQIKNKAGQRQLKKCIVMPARPIDTTVFNISNKFNNRNNILGYVGRLDKGKGVINLIKAFKLISNNIENIQLLIIGDGPLFYELNNLVVNECLQDKIIFIGWVSPEDVAKYLNKMKLMILPSYSEGLPVSILEAMACGTPVLATSVGGIPDIIKDGYTGFILKNNTPEEIAKSIRNILNSNNLNKIANRSRLLVKKEYTFKALESIYKDIFNELI